MVVCHKLAPAAFHGPSHWQTRYSKSGPLCLRRCPSSSSAGAKEFGQFISTSSSVPIPAAASPQEENIKFRGKAPFLISYISSNSYESLCDLSHKIHLENFDYCSWEYNYCGSAQSRWTDYITALIHTIWCLCRYENNSVHLCGRHCSAAKVPPTHCESVHEASLDINGSDFSAVVEAHMFKIAPACLQENQVYDLQHKTPVLTPSNPQSSKPHPPPTAGVHTHTHAHRHPQCEHPASSQQLLSNHPYGLTTTRPPKM